MRKHLKLLLVACLVVPLAFALAACGDLNDEKPLPFKLNAHFDGVWYLNGEANKTVTFTCERYDNGNLKPRGNVTGAIIGTFTFNTTNTNDVTSIFFVTISTIDGQSSKRFVRGDMTRDSQNNAIESNAVNLWSRVDLIDHTPTSGSGWVTGENIVLTRVAE